MISDCAFVRLATGVRLAYVEQGERDGIAIIFLHGYSDTHKSFDLLRPYLPQAWRSIAITQRGHGLSDKPLDGYGVADFATDVSALLDALSIERAVLVGHSMSAGIALQAAADYPERIAGIVMVSGFCRFRSQFRSGGAECGRQRFRRNRRFQIRARLPGKHFRRVDPTSFSGVNRR